MARRTVLLVDDNPQHLNLHSMLLQKAGFRPITAVVGEDYLSFQENEHPMLILLDYHLRSRITAPQTAQVLRATFKSAPIVLLSCEDKIPDDMKSCTDGFIQKGDPIHLLDFARKMLAGQ